MSRGIIVSLIITNNHLTIFEPNNRGNKNKRTNFKC